MQKQLQNILLHILLSLAFVFAPLLLEPGPDPFYGILHNHGTQRSFLSNLLVLIFCYFNYYILVPRFYFRKKYVLYIALCILSLLFVTYIPEQLVPLPPAHFRPPPGGKGGSFLFGISHNIFLFLIGVFGSIMLRTNRRWREAEKEKDRAELSYLKAQINPHFLFNTLNSIYALTLEKSDEAAPAVVKLSALMRYVITESDKPHTALQKEISYVSDFVDLQKLRLGDTVNISYQVTGTYTELEIAPLILIPFVENTFKHGVNPDENSEISIRIHVEGSRLDMVAENRIVHKVITENERSGLGIENTRTRLELLYPGKHQLKISKGIEKYVVSLTLHLE